MSSEPPPLVNCDVYNYANWNVETGAVATKSWALFNFLSKRVNDSAQGLISFISGIKTNTITAYSGNNLTIGEIGVNKIVYIYNPYLSTAIADVTDNSAKIPSTSWVQLWFGNIINNLSLTWASAQTFTLGILTNSINPIVSSGTIQIGHIATNSNVEIAAQASRSTILHLGDGDNASGAVHVNNGLAASGNVQVLNANYTGTESKGSFNLMTGSCGALTTGGSVNIQSGTTASICTIGNANSRLNVDCRLDVLTLNESSGNVNVLTGSYTNGGTAGNLNILSGSHTGTVTNGNINLQTGSCDGTTTIGNSVSTLALSAGTINVNTPLTLTYNPTAISAGELGFDYQANVASVAITDTRNCQCALNSGAALPRGVYFVSYMVVFSASKTAFQTGIAIPNAPITNGSTFSGTLYQYGGSQVNISGGTTSNVSSSSVVVFDGVKGCAIGISVVPNQTITTAYLQAVRIA